MPDLTVAAVTGPLGTGLGVIAPEVPQTQLEAEAHAEQLVELAKPVERLAPRVCIDGRVALYMLNGAEVKAGLKAAGGNGVTTYHSLELNGFFGESKSLYHNFGRTVYGLEENELTVGFHTDDKKAEALTALILKAREQVAGMSSDDAITHIEEMVLDINATGCGASDGVKGVNAKLSRVPQEKQDGSLESTEEVEARIEAHFAQVGDLAGEQPDRAAYDALVDKATELEESGYFNGWNPVKALLVADVVLNLRGVKDGVLSRIQVLHDDGKGAHGHTEQNINVIMKEDVTLETRDILEATGKKDFVVNAKQIANEGAKAFNNPAVALGAVMYQVGTKTHLTTAEQRGIVIA